MNTECPHCLAPLPPIRTANCPSCGWSLEAGGARRPEAMGTRLESVEDVRRLIQRGGPAGGVSTPASPQGAAAPPAGAVAGAAPSGAPPPPAAPSAARSKKTDDDSALPFRPSRRPQTALLTILDDDGEDGEVVRLRDQRYVIGRTQGDVTIPHDSAVSSTHLEINRVMTSGRYRWHVRDVGSTNGTYARVTAAPLGDGQEFLIGGKRLRFDAPRGTADAPGPDQRAVTQAWAAVSPHVIAAAQASLTVMTPAGEGERIVVTAGESWIGSDPAACKIAWKDDPLLSRRHAKLVGEPNGEWRLEAGRCRNGVWLRIKEIMVDAVGEFLIGEQRLSLRVVK